MLSSLPMTDSGRGGIENMERALGETLFYAWALT